MDIPVNGNFNIAGAYSVPAGNRLVVNATGNVNIGINGCMTVNGDILNNGLVKVNSTSTGTGSLINLGGVSGTGLFNIQRFLKAGTYNDVGSPVPDAKGSVFANLVSIRRWNEPSCNDADTGNAGYFYEGAGTTLYAGRGFVLKISADQVVNFISNRINTGEVWIPGHLLRKSTTSTLYKGDNFIANPYPCGVSIAKFLDKYKDSIQPYIMNYDQNSSLYAKIDANGKIWDGQLEIQNTNGVHPVLSVGQGFYVNVKPGFETVPCCFDDSMKVKSRNDCYFY